MKDEFNFKLWINLGFISIIKNAIYTVSKKGLTNEHHFYISFNTKSTGVKLSSKLLGIYEQEMTIVLQNQFTNLFYNNQGFGVTLFFNGVAEDIFIPWLAITNFFDPSIGLNLKIEPLENQTNIEIVNFKAPKKDKSKKTTEQKNKPKNQENIVKFSNILDFPK